MKERNVTDELSDRKPTYNDDDLLTINQFAEYISYKPNTIIKWRLAGVQLPTQLGWGKLIRYRKCEIDAWLRDNPNI